MENKLNPNQRFREWREGSGLRRADIADAFKKSNKEIGSSYQAIKDIEDGNRTINIDHLDVLMKSFNLNPLWILTGTGEQTINEDINYVNEPRAPYGVKPNIKAVLDELKRESKAEDAERLGRLEKLIVDLLDERDELKRKLITMHEDIIKLYKDV